VEPPAPQGTITVIGLRGFQSCAPSIDAASTSASRINRKRFIFDLPWQRS
jgi:hypothetical protein